MYQPILTQLLLLFSSLLMTTRALYFHMGETEKKCFVEEIPDETMITGKYRTQLFDETTSDYMPSSPGIGMHVEVKDPDQKIVLSKFYAEEGRFTFTSHTPGEHSICLHTNSTRWSLFAGGRLRVHLEMLVGEHATDYAEIAKQDKVSELHLRMRQLVDQVDMITKEQAYQRYREEKFRGTSESTNRQVLGWAMLQTIVLLATGFLQMHHLKSFFQAKKLV